MDVKPLPRPLLLSGKGFHLLFRMLMTNMAVKINETPEPVVNCRSWVVGLQAGNAKELSLEQ